jgi:hypothetical protein
MALDSTFNLQKWRIREENNDVDFIGELFLQKIFLNNRDNSWAIRLQNDFLITLDNEKFAIPKFKDWWYSHFGTRWVLFKRNIEFNEIIKTINSLDKNGGCGYSKLSINGVYFLEANINANLNGGSFCKTNLIQLNNNIAVQKTIEKNEIGQDLDKKLKREFEYLSNLNSNSKALFVPLIGEQDKKFTYGYLCDFIYAYTFSEKIFHGSINIQDSINLLENILSSLVNNLYKFEFKEGNYKCQENSIYERTIRRFQTILTSNDPIALNWNKLLNAERFIVNNIEYEGWPILKQWLDKIKPLNNLYTLNETCHGDLIFDDILVDSNNNWHLIDPNGDVSSRFYDLGKLTLSLLSGYEFLKYNRYNCSLEFHKIDIPSVELKLLDRHIANTYIGIASQLNQILINTNFVQKPVSISGIQLLIINGLHNASLPYFHLIHHRDYLRSVSFLALSIIRLNQAKRYWLQGKELSIDEAVELCSLEGNIHG